MPDPALARRARPVADVPALDGSSLAKAWLVALVDASALGEVGRLPLERFAAEAPALCDAVVAALASDRALARLEPGGDMAGAGAACARLAGARGPADVPHAVDAVRSVIWSAVATALPDGDPRRVLDLADRLGAVTAVLVSGALAAPPGRPGLVAVPDPDDVAARDARGAGRPAGGPSQPPGGATARRAQIERRLLGQGSGERPFAVLVAEVADGDRLLSSEHDGEVRAALQAAEGAVRAQLGSADSLVAEGPGRWWIVADAAQRSGRALAERIAAAISSAPPLHGVPLRGAVGVASYPADATGADALQARADERCWAARAAGVPVAD